MKSLKESISDRLEESIISSNNAGIISILKDILTHSATKKSLNDLNRIWKILKLDVEGFSWQLSSGSGFYAYNNSKRSNVDDWSKHTILLSGFSGFQGDIVIIKEQPTIQWTHQKSFLYMDELITKLNMWIKTTEKHYYFLDFN